MSKPSITLLAGLLLLVACQPEQAPHLQSQPLAESLRVNAENNPHPARPGYPAIEKQNASGQVSLTGQQLTLSLELYPKAEAAFRTQLLNLNPATKLQATVSDSHGKTYTANGADGNGAVDYSGGTITLTFENIVPDPLLFVEVQAKDGSSSIPQAELATVLQHSSANSPVNSSLSFQSTVAARALKTLLATHATEARSIDPGVLNTLTAQITGVTGTAPNLSYAHNHPSLVNTALLASHLQSQSPGSLNAADYRRSGASINLSISGLSGSDKVQVQITDAASAVQTNLGNGSSTVTGVTPGSDLQVLVTPFGSPTQTYSYNISPASLNLSEGNSTSVTVTATPDVSIAGFSPGSGAPGTSVTLSGTGFTGATAVRFNGVNAADFTVNSDTQITATVPDNATDGLITVLKGGAFDSASSFDVNRIWYVNHNASGTNTGTGWANAFTGLQSALTHSGAGDQIWIAAGTYTPHASDATSSFVMKAGVDIYGGFAGHENNLAARNPASNVVILSGDLNGNDNYTGTSFTGTAENSHKVVIAASAILDGLTVQGGTSGNGTGITINNVSPTLNKVLVRYNQGTDGAGIYITGSSAAPTLTQITVLKNIASNWGGGMRINDGAMVHFDQGLIEGNRAERGAGITINSNASVQNLSQISFKNNTSNLTGGGLLLFNSGTINLSRATFEANIASNDSGGGIYTTGSTALNISNAAFFNNTALQGGGLKIFSTITHLSNVSFSNNSAGFGGAIENQAGPSLSLKNTLFWNSTRSGANLGSGLGNVEAASDPFVNSGTPNGADGIPRTSDDGLRISGSAAGVIDQGITGTGVPDTDILDIGRNGNPEPGAYEYDAPGLPANVILVDKNASGANNGTSWANAYTSLQSALAAATAGKEIWVAAGSYTPAAANGDRLTSFNLKANVAVYGGFAGSESSRSARNIAQHVTILSGDLNGNDNYATQPFGNMGENSYHVVRGANDAILDGFTIQGGYADSSASGEERNGGGMINLGVSPTLNNLIFQHNRTERYGGGMYCRDSGNPTLSQVTFKNNQATFWGGGMVIYNASPSLSDVTFQENGTHGTFFGGGIHMSSNGTVTAPSLNRVSFINNSAGAGGGVGMSSSFVQPHIRNSVFSGNHASNDGGGMIITDSSPVLQNITFSNNIADDTGDAIEYDSGSPVYRNLLFWNNDLHLVDLGSGNGNVIAASNPFVNAASPNGPDGIPRTADDGLRLSGASAVLNQGNNTGAPALDILGNPRPGAGNTNAEPGAYEYTP